MSALKLASCLIAALLLSTGLNAQSNEPEEHPLKRLHKIKVHFENATSRDMFVAVTYVPYTKDGSDKTFTTQGWYKVKKGEKLYLFDTPYNEFYYYAETNKDFWGNQKFWKGTMGFNVKGTIYYFRKWVIESSQVVENKEENESAFVFKFTK